MTWPSSAASNSAPRFFSVSPIHFEMMRETSTRYSSRPSSRAITPATIVLPVPGPPWNSAVMPRAVVIDAIEAPLLEHGAAVADARDELAERVDDVGGQHDVGPRREARRRASRSAEPVLEVLAHGVVELAHPRRVEVRAVGARATSAHTRSMMPGPTR